MYIKVKVQNTVADAIIEENSSSKDEHDDEFHDVGDEDVANWDDENEDSGGGDDEEGFEFWRMKI